MGQPPVAVPARRPGWLDTALAEYSAHREEVLATTQAQHSTLALGVTAIGILAAGAFNVWTDDRLVASIVFLGAVPLLTSMILVIWVSQVKGMLNIGRYLLRLEASIARSLDDAPAHLLTWEKEASRETVLSRRPTYAWHYVAVLGLFSVLTASSIALGAYGAWDQYELEALIAAAAVAVVFSAIFFLVTWTVVTARNDHRRRAREVYG